MYTMRPGSTPHMSRRDGKGWDDSGRHLKKIIHNSSLRGRGGVYIDVGRRTPFLLYCMSQIPWQNLPLYPGGQIHLIFDNS